MKKRLLTGLTTGFFVVGIVGMVDAAPIDLNSWTQEGTASNGTWTVAPDGSSVVQSINGNPTYFVSNTSYINQEFNGSFKVETSSDDDFIGFVFGWNGIDDHYLFDWKQGNQGSGLEGFTLSHISGINDVDLWGHTGTDVTVIDSAYSLSSGWADNTSYDFMLNYTELGFSISIDGNQIFAEGGSFNAGQFGFYNYSQSQVRYQGFEEEIVLPNDPNAVPEPATMLLFGTGLVGLVGSRLRKKKK